MCEVRKAGRRRPGDPTDVVVGPRAVAGGDHLRQPVEHDPVVGGHDPGHDSAITQAPRSMSLCLTGRPTTPAMMSATSGTVSASGPVGAYAAPACASGSTNVSTATAAMSAASTNASAPPA